MHFCGFNAQTTSLLLLLRDHRRLALADLGVLFDAFGWRVEQFPLASKTNTFLLAADDQTVHVLS